jgi:hypothetical protein
VAGPGDIVLWGGDPAHAGSDRWSAQADGGSRAALAADGAALLFSFELGGPGSFAIARCAAAAELPAHWIARLRVRGETSAPVELQLKLVGAGGANVWWWRTPGFAAGAAAVDLAFRRLRLAFAWGPASGGEPRRIEAVEVAVAGSGARGRLAIEALRIEAREPEAPLPPTPALRASSARPGAEPAGVQDADAARAWRPAPDDAAPWLELDLGRSAEWGGLAVDFTGGAPPACRLLESDDGERWRSVADAPAGGPARQWLRTAEGEGRWLRLALTGPTPIGVSRVACVPLALAAAPIRHAEALARAAPRGAYPRHLLGEATAWALVAAEADERKALLGADGALEPFAGGFSIEPFLFADGTLASWTDAAPRPYLAGDRLPIPSVAWNALGLSLSITAFASGAAGASAILLRYAVENPGAAARRARLLLAIRPFQVTPVWQSLNLAGGGGFAPIQRIERTPRGALVNEAVAVQALAPPDAFGATPSDAAPLAAFLARGAVPPAPAAEDALGFAEAAFAFDLALAPGERATIGLAVPPHAAAFAIPAGLDRAGASLWIDGRLFAAERAWRVRLSQLPIVLPPAAARFGATLHASLGWVLLNREGPRIQPGPRCYRRSWIRDGALTALALAEQGFREEATDFLRWYAPHQHPDGRVPCAVDREGVDLAVEHDAHGQLAWAIVEIARLTGDRTFLRALWPHAARAVDAILALLDERSTPQYRGDARFGLLPESISHEGYASRPVHAYWDDYFGLAGLAAVAGAADGDAYPTRATPAELAARRDALAADLRASIERTIAERRIDFVPSSVELADFDPTSTAIALDPCPARHVLPPAALERTFDRWWDELVRRADAPPEAYSAYEIRNVVALLRLGAKDRALALLELLVADQRPPGWCQWPEVSWRPDLPGRFLGDLPHGWIASSFVRALRSLVVYERREDDALVLAAGIPEPWLAPPGIRLRKLPTRWGPLDAAIAADGPDTVLFRFDGARPAHPGGFVVVSPLARPLRGARIGGRAHPAAGPHVELRSLPAELRLLY